MLTISTKGNFSWKWEMSGNELLMETSRNRHPDQTCWAVFCSVSVLFLCVLLQCILLNPEKKGKKVSLQEGEMELATTL